MRVFFGMVLAVVLVAGGSASASQRAGCTREQYFLGLIPSYGHGRIVFEAGVLNEGLPACSVDVTLRVTVRRRDGTLAPIRGNPFVQHVSAQVAPWAPFTRALAWRNWCGGARRFVVDVTAGGMREHVRVSKPPLCRFRHRRSSVGRVALPFSGSRIPARMLGPDTPVPVSPSLIRVTNGWLVSNGRTLVAVYAGEAANDSTVGRFVIIRQNLAFGIQTQDIVDAGKTGAIRISQAPAGPAVETSAQHGDLWFSSATAGGVLHLATDTVELR